ncbi:MAG: ABC transporter ATP-binding protein [Lachnospiraceae bacterium]|nr:ABC transporter ATP-binding protein [Lachnospiraceae bacterium]
MITVEEVTKKYKNKIALSKVSFEIKENQILGLVGPNGAGKSTIMRIISDVNHATSGRVIRDKDISFSVVFDYNGLYPQMTAGENLLFYYRLNKKADADDIAIVEDTLKKLDLLEEKDNKVKTFSKGMLRKLAIARAIITDPNVLILDEPFDGLDVESHAYVIEFLKTWVKKNKKAVIFSSHNMSDVENICTNIVIISKGEIKIDSTMEKLKNDKCDKIKIIFAQKYPKEEIGNILNNAGYTKYLYSGNELFVESELQNANLLATEFIQNQYMIRELIPEQNSLEDIYMSLIGG